MVRCHISDDIKELALSISLQGITDSEIPELTGAFPQDQSFNRHAFSHRTYHAEQKVSKIY